MAHKRKPAPRRKAPAVTPERVETVLRLRLDGAQFHDLRLFAADTSADGTLVRGGPPWEVSDDDLWKLIDRADTVLVSRTKQSHAQAVALQLARRDALYARAVNAGDYSVAASILKDQAALLGMYPNVAELRKLVKAQDEVIKELDAHHAPRQLGPAVEGEAPAGETPVGDPEPVAQAEPEEGGG